MFSGALSDPDLRVSVGSQSDGSHAGGKKEKSVFFIDLCLMNF